MNPQRIVIVGAGFGGLNVAKSFVNQPGFAVTLIDKSNHHLFQPLLYQVATAALSPSDIAMPIREIFRKHRNIKTLMANVTQVIRDEKVVVLEDHQKIPYDYLILAPGSRHSYFGKSEWERWAPGLKTLKDALEIRDRVFTSFELAETARDQSEIADLLTFVVVGAGPTGVEMAGAITEIAHQSLKNDFRSINPTETKVYLIEGSDQVLNGYPKKLALHAMRSLEKKHVTVLLNASVTNISKQGIYIGDQFISTRNVIWAAGNEASSLVKTLNVPCDKAGRVLVKSDLSLPDDPTIFVIGDSAHAEENNKMLPAVAPVAVQEGEFVGKMIRKKIPVDQRPSFHYFDKGMMASIGKFDALVLSGPLQSSGFFAWLAWCLIHIYFLIGFRTKMLVFMSWVFYFFKSQRNGRLIIK